MDDEAHVRFVDSHSEGDGGDNHVDSLHDEVILCLGACGGVHSGVIGFGSDFVGSEHFGEFLHFFATQTVDDAAASRLLFDEFDDVFVDVGRFGAHFIVEVRSVEGAFKFCSVQDAEILFDVDAHFVCGCGSECNDGCFADFVDDGSNLSIFGSEVVSPF